MNFSNSSSFENPDNKLFFIHLGYLEKRLHILCFTETMLGIRVISFRKANNREVKKYEQSTID